MPEFSTSYVLQEVDPKWLTQAVKPKQFLHIDQAECILCEGCVDICPWKCIHMLSTNAIDEAVNADQPGDDPKDHVFFVVDEDVCTRCALCVDRCPTGVIILGKVTDLARRRPQRPHQPTRLRLRGPVLKIEKVSDYPRRRVSNRRAHLVVVLGGVTIAETRRGSACSRHAPAELLLPARRRARRCVERSDGTASASSRDARRTGRHAPAARSRDAAWSYESPSEAFAPIKDHLAFYAGAWTRATSTTSS